MAKQGPSINSCITACATAVIFFSAFTTFAQTAIEPDNVSYGVDLRDVAQYKTALKKEAQLIVNAMINWPGAFFPEGVRFLAQGPGFNAATRAGSVYGAEFIAGSKTDENGTENITVNALFNNKRNFIIRTYAFQFQKSGSRTLQLSGSTLVREVPLSQAHFKVRVALAQRKLIIEDETLEIKKIYPIGAGSLEESPAGVRVLTPKYREALIERRFVEKSRTFPSYYQGRPFIRLSVGPGGQTIYGFHYSITESLIRGFVSHGCMRMRDKDLYELYAIVMAGGSEALPVEMAFNIKEAADNPYPINNKSYYRVKNFGAAGHFQTDLDREGLTILENHQGVPPVENLYDPLAPSLN